MRQESKVTSSDTWRRLHSAATRCATSRRWTTPTSSTTSTETRAALPSARLAGARSPSTDFRRRRATKEETDRPSNERLNNDNVGCFVWQSGKLLLPSVSRNKCRINVLSPLNALYLSWQESWKWWDGLSTQQSNFGQEESQQKVQSPLTVHDTFSYGLNSNNCPLTFVQDKQLKDFLWTRKKQK